ncbi:site-specific DNA-methyltransferase, partial [candidate division WOR-3 bacterium]|nr:site-specific DNA-methyltransferase [candidate division WOR-3 bacterium]
KETTIRGRLNENIGKAFKRITRGVYIAQRGNAQALIIEGDAWEKIRDIESSSMDTIITDSPYTCLNKHLATGTTRKTKNKWTFKTKDIDRELMSEFIRVLKPSGHFFCFLPADSENTLKYNNDMITIALHVGFKFNKRWIWDKVCIGMGYNGRNRYEQIIFFSKGKRRKPFDLSIPDVLTHKRIHSSKRIHEAEKPIELIEDILKFSNQEGDIVLDTFAGSLTLAEAGLRRGINTVSIELDHLIITKSISERNLSVVVI